VGIEQDLATIAAQEQVLVFQNFSAETAWELGCKLRQEAVRRGAAMTFEIKVAGQIVFMSATDGASAGQVDWIRRKRNVVELFGKSSYAVGLELEMTGKTIEECHGLSLVDYAMHGGAFPLVLDGTGRVGSVIASGLAQRDDHNIVVEALAAILGVQVARLA
jgi:uncharacterized protein (UPF0303 family)